VPCEPSTSNEPFNSLDAQREACEAYIRSQDHELSQITSSRDAGVVPVDDRNRVH
jgi:hypothetical protein